MRFRDRLIGFMQGRYGADALSKFMSWASIALFIVSIILTAAWSPVAGNIVWYAALAVIVLSFCRMMSKNYSKRYNENQVYLKYKSKITGWFLRKRKHIGELRNYRFYSCPKCSQKVRIPRGKGKLRITCPKCGEVFIRRS